MDSDRLQGRIQGFRVAKGNSPICGTQPTHHLSPITSVTVSYLHGGQRDEVDILFSTTILDQRGPKSVRKVEATALVLFVLGKLFPPVCISSFVLLFLCLVLEGNKLPSRFSPIAEGALLRPAVESCM